MKIFFYKNTKSATIRFLLIGFMLSFVFAYSAFSQSDSVEIKPGLAFSQYRSRFIQEKLFVHTDKNSYLTGEIIWFRIFYADALYATVGKLSQIAYLEILNKNNQPVLQEKISLKPGESGGSVVVPLNLASGNYRLRSYTSWMKNFDAGFFFENTIRIINPADLHTDHSASIREPFDVQFFPEGGNLVQQMESTVGYRITDAYGKGQEFEGILINSNNDTVMRFHPAYAGLGHFTFTPVSGQTYRALIRFKKGGQLIKELPETYPKGYVMHLSTSAEGKVNISVHVSSDPEPAFIYLFVHGSYNYLPIKKEQVAHGFARFTIEANELEDGISQLTIFNQNVKPVAERLYFKYPEKKLSIAASLNPDYGTRKKIALLLSSSDASGNPLSADISLSVFRVDSLQDVGSCDIRSYFYLSAELGAIQSPAYYFSEEALADPGKIDNLMLTQGWRRYHWETMLDPRPSHMEFPPEIYGHIIHGKIINKTGGPASHIETYLSVPSTRTQFRASFSDSAGKLKFEMPNFYGSRELIVQTGPKTDSSLQIEINSPFSLLYPETPLPDPDLPNNASPTLLQQVIHEQVRRVYGGSRMSQFTLQPVDTNSFYVVPDEKYMLDDFTRFLTMEEVLREYVHSVNVTREKDKFKLYLADKPHARFFDEQPLILIDGVPFFDANELFIQDPKKIKRLDLINREYALGYLTFPGIVNVTTYQGDLNGIQMNSRAQVLDYPGIQAEREFYSPAYTTENEISSRIPDERTLLYWSPQILTNKEGKSQVVFYSSDLPGKYVAVMQGITDNGVPGTQVIYFSIDAGPTR